MRRFTRGLKNLVAGVRDWRELEPGIAVAEVMFQAHGWTRARRTVLVRQHTKERDFIRGRELFDDPSYAYQAILTDRTDAPEEVWRFYRGHADVENQIRELKWNYGIDGFCQKKFFATEAAFRLVCVTYNLISLFQERLGKKTYQTLGTLRGQLLACGAVVGREGRKTVLRLSLAGPWREQFEKALAAFFPMENANRVAVYAGEKHSREGGRCRAIIGSKTPDKTVQVASVGRERPTGDFGLVPGGETTDSSPTGVSARSLRPT